MKNWEWYKDTNVKVVFLHCLLEANYKDIKYKGKVIQRGSFITGYKNLADELNLSVQQVRTAIDKLKLTNEITTEATNKGTHIFVVNYTKFQFLNVETTNELTNEITDNQQTNNKQSNKRITTSKKYKEYKKDSLLGAHARGTPSFPSLLEIEKEIQDKCYKVDANLFFDYYEVRNWLINGIVIENWKALLSIWNKRENQFKSKGRDAGVDKFDYFDEYMDKIKS